MNLVINLSLPQSIQTCTCTTPQLSLLMVGEYNPPDFVTLFQVIKLNCTSGGPTIIHENQYQTDIITDKATNMLKNAIKNADHTPFFIGIAPTTPHMQVQINQSFTEPVPPPKYADLFPDAVVPRVDSYNVQGGVSWVKDLPELNQTVLDWVSFFISDASGREAR